MPRLFRLPLSLLALTLWFIAGGAWAAENTVYPIVIKHALGTTTIPKKPERFRV